MNRSLFASFSSEKEVLMRADMVCDRSMDTKKDGLLRCARNDEGGSRAMAVVGMTLRFAFSDGL
jgi:hypothetical protein